MALRLSLAFLVVATPAVSAHLLAAYFFDAGLFDARPIWSDEFIYWHEIATFREVGSRGGYYAYDEAVSALPLLHQGPHGPFFPAFFRRSSRRAISFACHPFSLSSGRVPTAGSGS